MKKCLLLFLLLPLRLLSQDITGVWTGTLYHDTTKQFLKYELAISEDEGKLTGYSHTTFIIDGIPNIGVKSVKVKKVGNDYLVQDEKLIYNNYQEPPPKGVRAVSDLVFSETDSAFFLKGYWKTNRTRIYSSATGTIFLQKKKEIAQTVIIKKLDSMGLLQSLSFYKPAAKPSQLSQASSNQVEADPENNGQEIVSANTKKVKSDEEKSIVATEKVNEDKAEDEGNKNEVMAAGSVGMKTPAKEEVKKEVAVRSEASQDLARIPGKDQGKESGEKSAGAESKPVERAPEKQVAPVVKNAVAERDTLKMLSRPGAVSGVDRKVAQQDLEKKSTRQLSAIAKPVIPPAAEMATRKVETIRSVEIKQDSLMLSLFDNGEIDGDTVSVLMNGNVIMPRQGLMSRAINKTIYLTPEMGDSIVLVMYAENLGSIPPNTGLLVIHDGEEIFEIRFSGDLKKSSAIILRRKTKL